MSFQPKFHITPRLVRDLEVIAGLRAAVEGAAIQVTWVPQLQKDSRQRGAHASTAIEGNPLTPEQVEARIVVRFAEVFERTPVTAAEEVGEDAR